LQSPPGRSHAHFAARIGTQARDFKNPWPGHGISYQDLCDSKRAGRNNVIIACGTFLSFRTLCVFVESVFFHAWEKCVFCARSSFFVLVPEAHFLCQLISCDEKVG